MRKNTQVLPALTSLRGLGALWVLLFHLQPESAWGPLKFGYLGVDLFFILSGFIISHVHAQDFPVYRLKQHMHFLRLRLIRIYPLHVFVLLIFAVLVLNAEGFVSRYPNPERFGFGHFLASLLLVNNWGLGPPPLWNTPTWSLSAEWLAYIAFPFISIVCQRLIAPRYCLGLAFMTLGAMAILLTLNGHPDLSGTGKAGLVRMLGGFIAGCLIAQYTSGKAPCHSAIHSLMTIACFLLANSLPDFPGLYLAAFVFVITAIALKERNCLIGFLELKPLRLLGEISFSIYLCHWPIIQLRNWALERGMIESENTDIYVIAVTLLIATLCWRLIEVPSRKAGRKWIAAHP